MKDSKQGKVLRDLLNGKVLSVRDIYGKPYYINSPTKTLSTIRQVYHLSDEWVTTKNGERYKRYWIPKKYRKVIKK